MSTKEFNRISSKYELSASLLNTIRFALYRAILQFRTEGRYALQHMLKRGMDIAGAGLLIIALSPVFLLTALLIKLYDRGPVFFIQTRVGIYGTRFGMIKFRSMVINADKLKDNLIGQNETGGVIFKMKNDPRVTPVGRFIRKYSIDELPQLFNVITGEMSLVGPRPPLPREVNEYTLAQRHRLDVVPGITCTWQVSGRSELSFDQQVNLDINYIRHQSTRGDISLLLRTIPAVLSGKGAY